MTENPCLPYPGRQIFVGSTRDGYPAFGYLVTGRSSESQQRRAVFLPTENAVRIIPLDKDAPIDELRHYQAVRIDPQTGLVVVSNSQSPVPGLFESYKSIIADGSLVGQHVLEELLKNIGPEPDSYKTPRIAAVLAKTKKDDHFRSVSGIVSSQSAKSCFDVLEWPKLFRTVSTYSGDADKLTSFDPYHLILSKYQLELEGDTAEQLAKELYEMSCSYDRSGDLRVCTIAGTLTGHPAWPGGWELAIKNRFE